MAASDHFTLALVSASLALGASVGFAPRALADCTTIQNAKAIAGEVQAFDYFGDAVSIKGTRAIIGSQGDDDRGSFGGSAYAYELVNNAWVKKTKLLAFDGVQNDRFGWSVAIDGNLAIVGSPFHDAAGEDAGTAYIYRYNGSTWLFEAKLVAADTVAWDHFGYGVAISGETVVIGAQLHDFVPEDEEQPIIARAGAAYVFKRDINGTWSQQGKLIASNVKADAFFGTNVAIDGDFVVVAAQSELGGGAAYAYKRTGATWAQEARLVRVIPTAATASARTSTSAEIASSSPRRSTTRRRLPTARSRSSSATPPRAHGALNSDSGRRTHRSKARLGSASTLMAM